MPRPVGRGASQYRILMTDDPPRELQRLVAIVGLGQGQCAIQDLACQSRGGDGLEIRDQLPRGDKAARTFVVVADIGRLQGEIDASCRAIHLIRRHDLLAEQETCLGSELDPRFGTEPDRCPIDDHHFALAQLQNEIRHAPLPGSRSDRDAPPRTAANGIASAVAVPCGGDVLCGNPTLVSLGYGTGTAPIPYRRYLNRLNSVCGAWFAKVSAWVPSCCWICNDCNRADSFARSASTIEPRPELSESILSLL